MLEPSSAYRFGDLLALAREHWVRQMAQRLAAAGHRDYRRSDAAAVRLLARGPRSIGEVGEALAISRQAARKLVNGLERRGYATTARDGRDARRLNVSLTAHGESFAVAIVEAIEVLNRALAERVDAASMRSADAVLRASLPNRPARERAARLIPPPD
ncbi:MAG: MarR family winged helix-turn-helix transcriptional regulator [Solirubrobacteraceae bacterium]